VTVTEAVDYGDLLLVVLFSPKWPIMGYTISVASQ